MIRRVSRLSVCVSGVALFAALAGVSLFAVQYADSQEQADPRLVTFGPTALASEGDHDFRQLIRFSVPAAAGRLHVRVFDADAGGNFDEASYGAPSGVYDTTTRFSLYGDGATARIFRDAKGDVQEEVQGTALDTKSFAIDGAADGRWITLFSVDAGKGIDAGDGRREFVLAVEGAAGNDGNVIDVAVSRADDRNEAMEGTKLYSFLPTFQVPRDGRRLTELGFEVPVGATELAVENFDAARGTVSFAGRFRSQGLTASGKSAWRRDGVALEGHEAAAKASVTAQGGGEQPNDMTLFVGERKAGGDAVDNPLPIELPLKVFAPNRRPQIKLAATPLACSQMRFDASASKDPDGRTLTYSWLLDGKADSIDGAVTEQRFASFGEHSGRLELVEGSGLVGSGAAQDFTFLVKEPPVARFTAPALVAEGEQLVLDGTASSAPLLPEGNKIAEYRWDLGDGHEVVQKPGDREFGRLITSYAAHGVYTVKLTVTDSADNPCNSATAIRTVTVNAPPVADAGGDRTVIAGAPATFDAGKSRDPDGAIVSWLWDFGDGSQATGPVMQHSYHGLGSYQVQLTVIDDSPFDSGKAVQTITVTVREPDNSRPVSVAGPDRTAEVGESVRFDGSQSTDADGPVLRYHWDFGDGAGSDLPAVEHTFWQPGTYLVALKVHGATGTMRDQSIDAAVITVTPAKNEAPVAAIPKALNTTTFRPLAFDASQASDSDGSVVDYRWDFGDGTSGSGPRVSHLYGRPGSYAGTLTLTDNHLPESGTASFPFTVEVIDRPNVAPVAAAGKDVTALVGEEFRLDASASTDPDGAIAAYHWDFGDGNLSTGVATRHIYQFPDTYEVKLKVTDEGPIEKLSSGDTLTVAVARPANQPPRASAGNGISAKKGEVIRFDGSASVDSDGNITAYRWEFGDGGTSSDAQPSHTFHDAGQYRVKLTVTDDGVTPLTAEAFVNVTVAETGGAEQ